MFFCVRTLQLGEWAQQRNSVFPKKRKYDFTWKWKGKRKESEKYGKKECVMCSGERKWEVGTYIGERKWKVGYVGFV